MSGLAYWAPLVGAAVWALSAHSHNPYGVLTGERAVIIAGLSAMVIGSPGFLVRYFFQTGQAFH